MKKHSLLSWLNDRSRSLARNNHGLTLAELLVAISIIPTILYASSMFQLHANQIMNRTYDRGMRLSDQLITFQYLERTMVNGSSAVITAPTLLTSCAPSEGYAWNYQLQVNLPFVNGEPQSPLFYNFSRQCGEEIPLFQLSSDFDGDGLIEQGEITRISYFGSLNYPCAGIPTLGCPVQPIVPETTVKPFSYDAANNQIVVTLGFKSIDPDSSEVTARSFIKLSGGSGT